MENFKLKNNISVVLVQNPSSQNVALCLNFTPCEKEKLAGTWLLIGRLLQLKLQTQLETNVEFSCNLERDFLRINLVCSNQELAFALDLLSDTIKNPPFEKFDEGKIKIREELLAELDLEKIEVLENYYKTLFEGHFYGNSISKTVENLDNITKEDVQNTYGQILSKSKKILSVVGDIDSEETKLMLNKYLGTIENQNIQESLFSIPTLKESRTVETIKSDVPKSLIVKGWIFPTYASKDFVTLVVLDAVLGFDGLCSRLFLELRGNQDIVYAVRSAYEPYKLCASFSIYISTDDENIHKSLAAADSEIDRLKKAVVEEFELEYAKKKLLGKYKKIEESNVAHANQLAFYETMGVGFDFQEKLIENIKKVTTEQIQACANRYFDDKFIVSILRP